MSTTLKPENADQVLDAVKWAVAEKSPLEVIGGGSKRALGRPMQTAATLDLSALSAITVYEPAELYITALAGTPLVEIEAALAEAKQQLSFEPPDIGPLLGAGAGGATIGGVVAANLAGPRRIRDGAARDHVLGFRAVSGRGEVFKSGGTVVKNVSGFDLSKLMAGSYGTLGVMTEITLKVLPAPEKVRTLLIRWPVDGVYDHAAMTAMSRALGSPHDVSAAAHLPAHAAACSALDYVSGSGGGITAIRVEGPGPSVEHRTAGLREILSPFGAIEELHSQNSRAFWREVGNVSAFVGRDDLPVVWRLSVPPAQGSALVMAILETVHGEVIYDWGGGQIWLGLSEDRQDAAHQAVRDAVARIGGHATLFRAPVETRGAVPVFQPLDGGEAAVTAKIKDGFDPEGILNPGRMYAGV